ncbi:MAG: disulfide bond formation protein B [Sinobacterium sp.]|nr:disulfide bond formation protein B [Sinobacterium sp.]
MQILQQFVKGPFYWVAMALLAVIAQGVALYYQYVLDDYPCLLCIHVRIWVTAFFLLGVIGFWLRRSKAGLLIAHVLSLIFSVGLLERSYVLYGTENGFIDGTCTISLGFPSWFALDAWVPWLFEVQGACGFTPNLWLGFTMAEGLLAASAVAVMITATVLIMNMKQAIKA